MTNPLIPNKYKNVYEKQIVLEKHVIIGASSVVLPGAYLAEGAAFGAFSLINKQIEPWSINVGIPCKRIKYRKEDILKIEQELKNEERYHK